MTKRDNILQELNELESSLVVPHVQNVYQVPDGYFENLTDNVMSLIKAMDTDNPYDEINSLSPFLSKVPKTGPYTVPVDYFQGIEQRLSAIINNPKEQTPYEELEELSPLLSGLKKQVPYTIPDNYFNNLETSVNKETEYSKSKIISISSHKWFRYAAAAVIISFVTVAAFLFLNKKETIDPKTDSYAWVKKSMNKVSTEEINDFITITDKSAPVASISDEKNDVKDLMKNISDNDIREFLKDADATGTDTDEDILLN